MGLRGNWLVVERLVTTALYKLLRLVFITVQRIYWQLNGTARKLREARLPQNYERSAQVLDVVLFHKFCPLFTISVENFICTHNRFEDPRYIIDNEHITLIRVNEHDAVFCEAMEKGMRLWQGQYGPFIRFAQMQFCRRLIIVPMSTFRRLAEEMGDPGAELIFLSNTGRCGSTLFAQIMECTGRCVAVSEPDSLNIVATKYRKLGDSPAVRQLSRDVIRWECRPYPTMQPQPLGYLVKFSSFGSVLLPMFRCLFMYRDMVAVAKSACRFTEVFPSFYLACVLGRLSGRMANLTQPLGDMGPEVNTVCADGLTASVLVSARLMASYLDLRGRGYDVSAVRYEDLVARPLDMCRVLLDFCHLPKSLAEVAVRAFDVDAQRNSVLAQSAVAHLKLPQLTTKKKTDLNDLLKRYGVPLIGKPCVLEGTLTCC